MAILLVMTTPCHSAPINLVVVDKSGAVFSDVLIIIKSLDSGDEICRYLTDHQGKIPKIQLGQDLYRIIAICPYGKCKTLVTERFGETVPLDFKLDIDVISTDIPGRLVGAPKTQVVIESDDHKPLQGLQLIVRDPEALNEKWYKTDAKGSVEVNLPSDPSVIVIPYKETVFNFGISKTCPIPTWGPSMEAKCTEYRPTMTHLILHLGNVSKCPNMK